MTTLIRYQQPWHLQRELVNEFNRFFTSTNPQAAESGSTQPSSQSGVSSDWSPAVDIEEHGDRFVLHADVPGVDPASIELTLEKGVLTVTGERNKAVLAEGASHRRNERVNGRFHRRFSLPDTVDSEAITAKNANGVLEVVIPKRPAVQPRRITVHH